MDAEVAALASSGAATLVGAMVSDAWAQVRDRVAGYFAHRGEPAGGVRAELDASRAEFEAARRDGDADAAADVEAQWRARLRRALRADPDAARQLRELLAELAPPPDRSAPTVVNSVSGGVQHGPVLQGHTFSALTFHTPATPPSPSPPGPDDTGT